LKHKKPGDRAKIERTISYLELWVKRIMKDEFAYKQGNHLSSNILNSIPDELQDYIEDALFILGL